MQLSTRQLCHARVSVFLQCAISASPRRICFCGHTSHACAGSLEMTETMREDVYGRSTRGCADVEAVAVKMRRLGDSCADERKRAQSQREAEYAAAAAAAAANPGFLCWKMTMQLFSHVHIFGNLPSFQLSTLTHIKGSLSPSSRPRIPFQGSSLRSGLITRPKHGSILHESVIAASDTWI